MRRAFVLLSALVVSSMMLVVSAPRLSGQDVGASPVDAARKAARERRDITPPGAIVANAGQWRTDVLYADMLGRYAFTRDGVLVARPREDRAIASLGIADLSLLDNAGPLRYRFVNPSPAMRVEAGGATGGRGNIYGGPDSAAWRSGLPLLSSVVYRNVWDSVDAEFREDDGRLALTVRLRAGADPRDVRIASDEGDIPVKFENADAGRQAASNAPAMNASPDDSDFFAQPTQFSTYFGLVTNPLMSMRVHTDGSMFLCGWAQAASYGIPNTSWVLYVMHLGCDGTSIQYTSLYYARDGYTLQSNGYKYDPVLCVRHNGAVVVGSQTRNAAMHIPLTPDALEKSSSSTNGYDAFFFELDSLGVLRYATIFGSGPDVAMTSTIMSMATDSRDNLCIGGSFSGQNKKPGFRYRTPGTVDGVKYAYAGNFVVKLRPSLDSVLWGTRVGCCLNNGHGEMLNMVMDDFDNVLVCGLLLAKYDSIPLVREHYPPPVSGYAMFLQKLTPDADAFIYSTPLPVDAGSYFDEGSFRSTRGNTAIITGTTSWKDMPVVGSSRGYHGQYDGFVVQVDSTGQLLRSFYIGGSYYDGVSDADIDEAGNIHILGWTNSRDFPFLNYYTPYKPLRSNNFLAVIAAGSDSLLYSTPWSVNASYWSNSRMKGDLQLRPDGYVYFNGQTSYGLPAFNGLYNHPVCVDTINWNCVENFITRLHLPFASKACLQCALTGTDALRLETSRGIFRNGHFTVTAHIVNASSRDTAYNATVTFALPAGVKRNPDNQSLTQYLRSPFLPGDTATCSLVLHVDSIRSTDTMFTIRSSVDYDPAPVGFTCERLGVHSSYGARVLRFTSPQPAFACVIEAPDTLVTFDHETYAVNPFLVRLRLRNVGDRPFSLSSIIFNIPEGAASGLTYVPANDSARAGGTLGVHEEVTRDWTLRAAVLPNPKDIELRVSVIDSFGIRLPAASDVVHRPALEGGRCTIVGPTAVAFDAARGEYDAAPIMLELRLSHQFDTTVGGIAARLNLAQAPHLRLSAGESFLKYPPPVPPYGSVGTRWYVEVIPHPAGSVRDTLVMRCTAPKWTEERTCMHVVEITPPVTGIASAMTVPQISVTASGGYDPDTIAITWSVTNRGELVLPAATVRLTMSGGDTAWCIDPMERALSPLAPMQGAVRVWRLVVPTSAFARRVALDITQRDGNGVVASRQDVLDIPRVDPAVACALAAPDTLHYDKPGDRYAPDPADLVLTVTNRVDTAAAFEARLDLASAPRLALAPGESGRAARIVVAPHAVMRAAFRVTVDRPPDSLATDFLKVITTAFFGDVEMISRCEAPVAVDGRASGTGVTAPPRPDAIALWCAPNPVRPGGTVEVRCAGAPSGVVRLRLLDALGREVTKTQHEGTKTRGDEGGLMRLTLPAHLASGLYFIEVAGPAGRMVRGIAVVR